MIIKSREERVFDIVNPVVKKHLPSYDLIKKDVPVIHDVKPKSKKVFLFDAGHGDVNPKNGKYQSPHKKHIYKDGFKVLEGVLNRLVLNKVLELAKDLPFELRYELIAHEWKDTPLKERSNKVNDYCDLYGVDNCELLSIHHNGHQNPAANGIEVFYWGYNGTRFSVKGAKSAIIFNDKQSIYMPEFRNRGVKFANYHIIREVKCPAILSEGGFMTNREDAEEMTIDKGVTNYAKAVIEWIRAIEENTK